MKNTPQTKLVLESLKSLGHATNNELLEAVHAALPDITITSVHRITTRLVQEGYAGLAPGREGVAVIDANPQAHHHFVCRDCYKIKDIELPSGMIATIQSQLPREILNGGLAVYGSCKECPGANQIVNQGDMNAPTN